MASTDKVIDMVRKLRAYAEGGRTVEEQAAFAAKVRDLMDRYRISEDQVAATTSNGTRLVGAATWVAGTSSFTKADIKTFIPLMACVVGKAYACRAIIVEGRAKVHFVGREADRTVAVFMMDHLARTAVAMAEAARQQHRRAFPDENRSSFRADFLHGFVCCIDERYAERRNQTIGELMSEGDARQALVRLSNELVVVDRWLATADDFANATTGSAESQPSSVDVAVLGVGAALDQCLDTNGIAQGPAVDARRIESMDRGDWTGTSPWTRR